MPTIKVTAALQNITPDPKTPSLYQWSVKLAFNAGTCPNSLNRQIVHPEINESTLTNTFTIPFNKIRGGDLTVSVSVRVGSVVVTAKSEKLQVTGTNPSVAALKKVPLPQ